VQKQQAHPPSFSKLSKIGQQYIPGWPIIMVDVKDLLTLGVINFYSRCPEGA
jgi:hypothetical protein